MGCIPVNWPVDWDVCGFGRGKACGQLVNEEDKALHKIMYDAWKVWKRHYGMRGKGNYAWVVINLVEMIWSELQFEGNPPIGMHKIIDHELLKCPI